MKHNKSIIIAILCGLILASIVYIPIIVINNNNIKTNKSQSDEWYTKVLVEFAEDTSVDDAIKEFNPNISEDELIILRTKLTYMCNSAIPAGKIMANRQVYMPVVKKHYNGGNLNDN